MPNRALEIYRSKFQDDRPDDVVILELGQQFPELFTKYPDFKADYDSIQSSIDAANAPGASDYAKQAYGSFVRGAAGVVASTPESLVPATSQLESALGPAAPFVLPVPSYVYDAEGKLVRQATEAVTPESNPQLAQSLLASKLPAGLGSAVAFMAGGAALKAAKIPGWIGIAALGSSSSGVDFYQDAKANGADERTAFLASLVGNVVGTSEAVPLARMLNRLDKLTGGQLIRTMVTNGIKETFEEAVQEFAQQFLQNATAVALYEKDRSLSKDLADNATVGGITGALFSLITHGIGAHHGLKEPASATATQPSESPTVPPAAGQPRAPAAPAASATATATPPPLPVIPDVAKPFVQDDQGNAPDDQTMLTLRALAQQDLAGTLTLRDRTWVEQEAAPYIRNAYTLVLDQLKAENLAAPAPAQPAATETTTETSTIPEGGEIGAQTQVSQTSGLSAEQRLAAERQATEETQTGVALGSSASQQEVTPAAAPVATTVPPTPAPVAPAPAQAAAPAVPAPSIATVVPPGTQAPLDIDAILDRVDFERKSAPIMHGSIQREPAFFDIEPQPYTATLAERLTVNARGTSRKNSDTKQITFFHDQETGQVVGLGTFRAVGSFYVGRMPGDKHGSSLERFMASGRYVPIGSTTLHKEVSGTNPETAIRFRDINEYQTFRSGAKERIARQLGRLQDAITQPTAMQETEPGKFAPVAVVPESVEELIAGEPFTRDEALAIWQQLAGVRKDGLATAISEAARRDLDFRLAVLKVFKIFTDHGITDEKEALQTIIEFITDARTVANGRKANFTKSFSEAVTRASSLGLAGIRGIQPVVAPTALPPTATVPGPAGSSAGAEPGAASPPGQTGPPVPSGTGEPQVRLHTGRLEVHSRASPTQVAAAAQATVHALARAGYNVTVINQEQAAMAQEMGEGGAVDNANQTVTLVMGDVTEPTVDNLYHLNAEAAHAVFAGLPENQRVALQDAVRGATDEVLGLTREVVLAPGVRATEAVLQEERLVDLVAKRMTEQGFNPEQAAGLAQKFWNFLKGLWYRAALALSKAWSGSGQASANLAASYLQTRVESFLAGNLHPFSFTDFMGGGRVSAQQRNLWFEHASGHAAVTYRWNPQAGQIEVQPVDAFSAAAVFFNASNPTIRYHGPTSRNAPAQVSTDITPEVVLPDIASINETVDNIGQLFNEWQNRGGNITAGGGALMNPDQFREWLTKQAIQNPTEMLGQIVARLQQIGQQVPNVNVRMNGFNGAAQRDVASKSLAKLKKLFSKFAERYRESGYETSSEPGSQQRRYDRNAVRAQTLSTNYVNDEVLFADAKSELLGWLRWMKTNAKSINTLAHRDGVLEQVVRELEGKLDEPLSNDYSAVIDRLVNRFADSRDTRASFVNILEALVSTELPFSELSIGEINDAIVNSTYPELASPALDRLREHSLEGRALRSVAIAFAKRNDLLMTMIALKAPFYAESRTIVNTALQLAMSDQADAFRMARNLVPKENRLQLKAYRALAALEKLKNEQDALRAHLQEHRNWMHFYEATSPLYSGQAAKYESVLGAVDENFEAYPSAPMLTAENPNESPDLITARTPKLYSPERSLAADALLRQDAHMMQQWLDAHPAGNQYHRGNVYNRFLAQIEKIGENDMQAQADKGTRSFVQNLVGPMTAILDHIGLPATKQLARAFRSWASMHYEVREAEQKLANRWSVAAVKAMKALGYRKQQMELFLEEYYDAAFSYMDRRTDLAAATANDEEAFTAKLAAAQRFFNLPADQWKALESLLRITAEGSNKDVGGFYTSHGGLVADDDAGIFRSYRGGLGEVSKAWHGNIRRIYGLMQGEPQAEGPWALAAKPTAVPGQPGPPTGPSLLSTVAQDYTNDPNALRTKLQPLFNGEIWTHFAEPLARRSARSAFAAAPDQSGTARLATVAETNRAFDQAQPGDVVRFAEALYALTGGAQDPAGLAAFVAETVGTFDNYFKWLHKSMQESSNLAGRTIAPVSELMMNARKTDEAPAQWTKYRRFDIHSTRSLFSQLGFHLAFGRNLETAEKLFTQAEKRLKDIEEKLADAHRIVQATATGKSQFKVRSELEAVVRAMGENLDQMETASKNLNALRTQWNYFKAFAKSQGGVSMDFKSWAEMLSTAVTLTMQGPKTAFFDTSSLFKPIQMFGFTRTGVGYTAHAVWHTIQQVVGGFLETLHLQIKSESEEIKMLKELAQTPTADEYGLVSRLTTAGLGYPVTEGQTIMSRIGRGAAVWARAFREIVNTPIPSATKAEDRQYLRVRPAIFTYSSQAMHLGSIAATWRMFKKLTMEASQFLGNPGNFALLNDPAFRFTAAHARAMGYSEAVFKQLIGLLDKNGMTLEDLAKDYLRRTASASATAPVLTPVPILDQKALRRLMVIGPSELMQEASVLTRPGWNVTSPFFRQAMPFLGWTIQQTASIDQSFRQPISGERLNAWNSMRTVLLNFVPLLGVGLAYSLLADRWDEDVLKKKSNRLSLTGDNLAMAVLDRVALTGLLGIAGDIANAKLNFSTARDITIDSRVFFVNAVQNIMRSVGTWFQQGHASYSTVGRPLIMSIGGSGALQYLQAVNGILGLDNPESRATARINTNNWITVAGRELNLPVRAGARSSGDFTANRTTPWIREMFLAALADDGTEFSAAYTQAILAARDDHRQDPKDYVRRAYQYQNPLRSVFQTAISETDYRLLLQALPDNGKRDVAETLRLFNRYGTRLGLPPYYGERSRSSPAFTRNELLRKEASGFTLNNLF